MDSRSVGGGLNSQAGFDAWVSGRPLEVLDLGDFPASYFTRLFILLIPPSFIKANFLKGWWTVLNLRPELLDFTRACERLLTKEVALTEDERDLLEYYVNDMVDSVQDIRRKDLIRAATAYKAEPKSLEKECHALSPTIVRVGLQRRDGGLSHQSNAHQPTDFDHLQ